MYVLIEHCEDGSFYPIEFRGSFESLEDAQAAMLERAVEAETDYDEFRNGVDWSPIFTSLGAYYASLGIEWEGEIYEWYIFDTDDKR